MADARRYFGGRVVKIVPPRFPSFGYETIISRYSAFYVRRIHRRVRERARARVISRSGIRRSIGRVPQRATCPSFRGHRCVYSIVINEVHESRIRPMCQVETVSSNISPNFSRSLYVRCSRHPYSCDAVFHVIFSLSSRDRSFLKKNVEAINNF